MSSKTDIFNMALSHIGAKTVLTDTEQSAEAMACQTFYDNARDGLLRLAEWGFARKQESLALVSEDPVDDWSYSYQYPSDCVRFVEIVGQIYFVNNYPTRITRPEIPIPHKIYKGSSGKEIYCNESDAEGIYVSLVTETGLFAPDFVEALSYKLASLIAPRVVGSDNFQIKPLVMEMAKMSFEIAAANSLNEDRDTSWDESGYARSRQG